MYECFKARVYSLKCTSITKYTTVVIYVFKHVKIIHIIFNILRFYKNAFYVTERLLPY